MAAAETGLFISRLSEECHAKWHTVQALLRRIKESDLLATRYISPKALESIHGCLKLLARKKRSMIIVKMGW